MTCHIEDLSSAIYWFHPGQSYAAGDEPKTIGCIARKDHGEVEIMATKGELTKQDILACFDKLRERGVHRLHVKRRKGHRMPFGKKVRSDQSFDYYQVDL